MQHSRLSLIRFATYFILVVAIVTARRRHYFIPAKIPLGQFQWWVEWSEVPEAHHGGGSLTLLPGFADTKMSGSEVLHAAETKLHADRRSLADYEYPTILLREANARLLWSVDWKAKSSARKNLRVWVNDTSRDVHVEEW